MALPIAHATAGYLIHRLDRRRTDFDGWRRALAFMVIANLPDADFLVGFAFGAPGALHRGVSHTVLAALVFGAATAAFAARRRRERFWSAFVIFAAVYASHLLVDAFTVDARGPAGARFLWPLSQAYYISPVTVFHEILIDGRSRSGFLQSVLAWPTVVVLAREALIAAVLIGAYGVAEAWWPWTDARARVEVALAVDPPEEDLA